MLAAIAAVPGCAPALREPPARVADLPRSETSRPEAGVAPDAGPLALADALWDRRPDAASVRRAEVAYLDAAERDPDEVTGLVGAVRAKAWLVEHGAEAAERERLAVGAVQTAQICRARDPRSARCLYWLAVAVGLQARERPATGPDGVREMISLLTEAESLDPAVEEAGPARVLALVLLRAPGWPLGPGDPEAGIEAAARAVALRPGHPPNRLALAEALRENGRAVEALAAYEEALAGARRARAAGDRDASDWARDAEAGINALRRP